MKETAPKPKCNFNTITLYSLAYGLSTLATIGITFATNYAFDALKDRPADAWETLAKGGILSATVNSFAFFGSTGIKWLHKKISQCIEWQSSVQTTGQPLVSNRQPGKCSSLIVYSTECGLFVLGTFGAILAINKVDNTIKGQPFNAAETCEQAGVMTTAISLVSFFGKKIVSRIDEKCIQNKKYQRVTLYGDP